LVVYEATTKAHFDKIREFVARQPIDYECLKYWLMGCKGEDLWELKKKRKNLHVYVVEDEGGDIRFVLVKAIKPCDINGKTVKVWGGGFKLIDERDWRAKNWKYTRQLAEFVTKQHYREGVKFALYSIPSDRVTERKGMWTPQLSDASEIICEVETETGEPMTLVRLDYEKYLKNKGMI